MEWETLQRLAQLVKDGAMLYGPKPMETFSMRSLQNKQALVALANEVWGDASAAAGSHRYGKGKVSWGMPVADVLQELQAGPDFSSGRPDSLNLMYIHKKTGAADVYFVFNQQKEPLQRECTFRVSGKRVEIWNPQYGSVVPVPFTAGKDGLRVPVTFQPREALIFVITNEPAQNLTAGIAPRIIAINNFKGKITFRPPYAEAVPSRAVTSLKSYTDFADSSIRYFAGVAHYTIQFNTPSGIGKADSVLLSLGDMDATAEVRLNKKLLGYAWMPWFRMNVSGLLQARNTLEITIANTYRNRIIGDYRQYGTLKNAWTSANVADELDKNKTLKPSGVIGPLQLILYKEKPR
jgi:hypothetical protein